MVDGSTLVVVDVEVDEVEEDVVLLLVDDVVGTAVLLLVDVVVDVVLLLLVDDVVGIAVLLVLVDVVVDVLLDVVVVVPASRIGWTVAKYAAKAPSTVALLATSQESFGLSPHAPESCPTTWPAPFRTGEPLLPPSVAPKVSLL